MEQKSDEAVSESHVDNAEQQAGSAGAQSTEEAGAPTTEVLPPTEGGPEDGDSARVREQLLRLAADFDNYRKRARRDVEEAEQRVQERLVRSLLPTFDNIERAFAHADTAQDVKSLADGLKMVMRQFGDTLSGLGIERVESVGKPFDPGLHEAVQHTEHDSVPAGAVAVELQPGYSWKGRLVRPAMVVVSKGPPAADSEAGA